MKVRSPLADMEIGIGSVSRKGNDLVLRSGSGSSIDTEITVSAGEVLRTIGLVLSRPAGLAVRARPAVLLAAREVFRHDPRRKLGRAQRPVDINKPW